MGSAHGGRVRTSQTTSNGNHLWNNLSRDPCDSSWWNGWCLQNPFLGFSCSLLSTGSVSPDVTVAAWRGLLWSWSQPGVKLYIFVAKGKTTTGEWWKKVQHKNHGEKVCLYHCSLLLSPYWWILLVWPSASCRSPWVRTPGKAWHPNTITSHQGLVHSGIRFYSVEMKAVWFVSAVTPQCLLCFSAGVSLLVWRVSRDGDGWFSSWEMVVWVWLRTHAFRWTKIMPYLGQTQSRSSTKKGKAEHCQHNFYCAHLYFLFKEREEDVLKLC